MVSLIQHFEADFLWKVSLKIMNSGIILKTLTHTYAQIPIIIALAESDKVLIWGQAFISLLCTCMKGRLL